MCQWRKPTTEIPDSHTKPSIDRSCSVLMASQNCRKLFSLHALKPWKKAFPFFFHQNRTHDFIPDLARAPVKRERRELPAILHSSSCIRLKIQISGMRICHVSPSWRHLPRDYFHCSAGASQNPLPQTCILMRPKLSVIPLLSFLIPLPTAEEWSHFTNSWVPWLSNHLKKIFTHQ